MSGKNYCKVEGKWCKFLKRGVCTKNALSIDEVNRCPRLAEIETIRLSTIIHDVDFDNVFSCLCYWFKNQENSINGYRDVFNLLLTMNPKKHCFDNMFINVDRIKGDNDDEYLNVSGVNLANGKKYSIEFCPWVDWISMFITSETLKRLSKEEIVAACLYEMTFFGFTENKVSETLGDLSNSIKRNH